MVFDSIQCYFMFFFVQPYNDLKQPKSMGWDGIVFGGIEENPLTRSKLDTSLL